MMPAASSQQHPLVRGCNSSSSTTPIIRQQRCSTQQPAVACYRSRRLDAQYASTSVACAGRQCSTAPLGRSEAWCSPHHHQHTTQRQPQQQQQQQLLRIRRAPLHRVRAHAGDSIGGEPEGVRAAVQTVASRLDALWRFTRCAACWFVLCFFPVCCSISVCAARTHTKHEGRGGCCPKLGRQRGATCFLSRRASLIRSFQPIRTPH
jgi:hypothetical protein